MTYAIKVGDLLVGPFATVSYAEQWALVYAEETRASRGGREIEWSVVPVVGPCWMNLETEKQRT